MSEPTAPGPQQPEQQPPALDVQPSAPVFQPPPQYAYGSPMPQIVTKPGGLSGGAHAAHLIAVFLTFGVWLIPYLIIAVTRPRFRYEVSAPLGTDPALVQQAYAQANAANRASPGPKLTPEQKAAARGSWKPLIVTFVVLALTAAAFSGLRMLLD